jgi:putative methionine-R-sulfoxide reductase with GAF domain
MSPYYTGAAARKIELPAAAARRAAVKRTQASLELLNAISQFLANVPEAGGPWAGILQLTVERMGASSGAILVLDAHGAVVDGTVAYKGTVHPSVAEQLVETAEQGLAGWVIENRRGALIQNTLQDARWLQRPWEGRRPRPRSAISVPLIETRGVMGVITLTHDDAGFFSEDDLALLTAVSSCISLSGVPLAAPAPARAERQNHQTAAPLAPAPPEHRSQLSESSQLSEAE